MSKDYQIEPSDFMEGWYMVRKAGERTEHFRTRDEAERYARSPTYREDVQRRYR